MGERERVFFLSVRKEEKREMGFFRIHLTLTHPSIIKIQPPKKNQKSKVVIFPYESTYVLYRET